MITDILPFARKLNNYEADATSGTLWVSTTQFKVVCPTGKRWYLLYGVFNRTVNASVVMYIRDISNQVIGWLGALTAATGVAGYPYYTGSLSNPLRVIDAGEYVSLEFGAAQDANAYASCVVLEVDV